MDTDNIADAALARADAMTLEESHERIDGTAKYPALPI